MRKTRVSSGCFRGFETSGSLRCAWLLFVLVSRKTKCSLLSVAVRISLGAVRGTLSGSVNPRHSHCCLGDRFGKNSHGGAGPADPQPLRLLQCRRSQGAWKRSQVSGSFPPSDGSISLTVASCGSDAVLEFKIALP